MRSITLSTVGEKRVINISHPFAECSNNKFWTLYWPTEANSCNVLGPWIYLMGTEQGDLGHTMLVREDDWGNSRLVCYTEWRHHCGATYLGNIILSDKTINNLSRFYA